MRLLYILLSPTFGMHQYTADLANRMAEGALPGCEVHLLTTAGFPADRYAPAVQTHTPVTLSNTGLSRESLQLNKLRRLQAAIDTLQPDLVHFTGPHLWNVGLVRRLAGRGVATVHTIHDLDPHAGARGGRLLYLWNWLIGRSASHLLVHGRVYRERLLKQGLDAGQVTATPLLHLFLSYGDGHTPRQSDPPTDSTAPLALFFGRLERYKGVDILLEAYGRLAAGETPRQSPQPRLILAGPGQLADFWPGALPGGVELRNGLIEDHEARRLFQRCSLVVLPYIDATQSALVAAAYYFGKPVLVTRSGALPEYVIEGRTGFIVEPNDPAGLARTLAAALADRGRLQAMGEAGRAWYDCERAQETADLLALYQRCAPATGQPQRLIAGTL